jgi:hypothetical protein
VRSYTGLTSALCPNGRSEAARTSGVAKREAIRCLKPDYVVIEPARLPLRFTLTNALAVCVYGQHLPLSDGRGDAEAGLA